ncbi:hypothetical protein Q5H92_08360 [Hymenobacter sp. M29]|uniref:Uncharacterized protein n=1 Tax=Hymenobacter mellowenesis TaxID=3063995 RepID=A0ABT9AAZ6_9BACT|nr:hypothetical protein [Hymenobacter sp. M29]MDO7846365.1 hypothetical protein [Hymenobacter sp. M29]
MKKLLLAFLLGGLPALASAQTFDVPAQYTLSKPDDFARYEPQVISTINWLEATPVNQDVSRRKQAQRFLLEWASGSPKVSIGIEPYLGDLYGKQTDLLMAFMGGWTRYSLQHPNDTNTLTLNAEGVQAMLKLYALGGLGTIKPLENVRDLAAAGELNTWLKGKISQK